MARPFLRHGRSYVGRLPPWRNREANLRGMTAPPGPDAEPARQTDRRHVTFTLAGFRRGYVAAQALAVGVLVWGVTFGLLARGAELSPMEAVLMSATVYSGTAQSAMVNALAAGAGVGASVVTIVMLNARYLLYGAALRPWLGRTSPVQAYSSLYFLGDSNWLLSLRVHAQGERDAAFVLGSGMAMFIPWVGGTLVGAVAAAWMANPATLGLDFLLVAFCAALGIGMFKPRRTDGWTAIVALGVALVLDRIAPSGWTVVAAGIAGAAAAYFSYEPAAAVADDSQAHPQ
jgi:predicted branched-subunit amino acid permease